jgi:predicted ribosome quality control (RQC) complex YloA/Tae2 family protein
MTVRQRTLEIDRKQYTILIGRNRFENTAMLKQSSPHDIWFHFEDLSGPHIVLKTEGDEIPKRYLYQCAVLLREFKSNVPPKASVIYTLVKYVRPTNVPGEVIVRKTSKIFI